MSSATRTWHTVEGMLVSQEKNLAWNCQVFTLYDFSIKRPRCCGDKLIVGRKAKTHFLSCEAILLLILEMLIFHRDFQCYIIRRTTYNMSWRRLIDEYPNLCFYQVSDKIIFWSFFLVVVIMSWPLLIVLMFFSQLLDASRVVARTLFPARSTCRSMGRTRSVLLIGFYRFFTHDRTGFGLARPICVMPSVRCLDFLDSVMCRWLFGLFLFLKFWVLRCFSATLFLI